MADGDLPQQATEDGEHAFIGITLFACDLALDDEGEVIYAPHLGRDEEPRFTCRVCWQPATPEVIRSLCPGPDVDAVLGSILGGDASGQ